MSLMSGVELQNRQDRRPLQSFDIRLGEKPSEWIARVLTEEAQTPTGESHD
jgi:hypothetical protein